MCPSRMASRSIPPPLSLQRCLLRFRQGSGVGLPTKNWAHELFVPALEISLMSLKFVRSEFQVENIFCWVLALCVAFICKYNSRWTSQVPSLQWSHVWVYLNGSLGYMVSFQNRARMVFTRTQLFWKALAHNKVKWTSEQESGTPKTTTLPVCLPWPTNKKSYKFRSLRTSEWPKSEVTVCDIGEVIYTSTLIPIDRRDTYLKRIISLVIFFFFNIGFYPKYGSHSQAQTFSPLLSLSETLFISVLF